METLSNLNDPLSQIVCVQASKESGLFSEANGLKAGSLMNLFPAVSNRLLSCKQAIEMVAYSKIQATRPE